MCENYMYFQKKFPNFFKDKYVTRIRKNISY